jgi:Caspase domain
MTLKSNQKLISKGKTAIMQEQQVTNAPMVPEVTKVRNHLFVISINDYKFCPPLYNAVKDADDITRILTNLYDFDPKNVVRLSNAQATESNILAQLDAYIKKLSEKDSLVIYYSGHGTYKSTIDEGYWVPVDVDFHKASGDIDSSRCLANSMILKYLHAIKSLHTVVIADACFSGSLATQKLVGTGADRLETIPSRCILTAGRNEPVLDGKPGDNSPFASALARYLEKNVRNEISFTELGKSVQKAVANNSTQIPICARLQNAGDQNGEFVFHKRQDESTFWADILRFNTVEGYKGYLTQYPNGKYVKEANEALKRLEKPVAKPNGGTEIAVKQGTILYDVPSKMQLLQEVKCVVRIAFDEVMAKLDYKITPDTEFKTMRVSNVMNVELFDASQQAFEIRTVNARQQFIDRDYFTQWLFYVKPLKEGNYTLLLKVTLIEEINGLERPREIVLEETVSIVANLPKPEASRVRAVSEKIVFGPAAQPKAPNTPIQPNTPNTPIQPSPKNHNTNTNTNTNGTFSHTDVGPQHKDNGNLPPMEPTAPLVVPKVNPNRRWFIGGGSSLAVLLAIFWIGKTFWKPLDNGTEVAAAKTRGDVTEPIPTPKAAVLKQDTQTLQAIKLPQTPKSVLPPAVKPVQSAKQSAPNLAEAKPKPKPKLPTEASTRANADVEEDRNAGLMGDRDPRNTTMKSAIEPNATRFAFREPPAGMKPASNEDADAWRNAKLNGEAEAYKKYLDAQPKGAYRDFAKERWNGLREENDWHQTQDRKSWDGYHQHMQKYPQGRHAQEAAQRKKELEPQRNEPK